jgi:hypothetical protein
MADSERTVTASWAGYATIPVASLELEDAPRPRDEATHHSQQMSPSAENQGEHRLPQAQAALCKVARELSKVDGHHQFYPLTRVQSVTTAIGVDRELAPWVLAALITRPDFDAFYALRESPGTYLQLRTQLSTPVPRSSNFEASDAEFEDELSSVLDWLDLASEFDGFDWSAP